MLWVCASLITLGAFSRGGGAPAAIRRGCPSLAERFDHPVTADALRRYLCGDWRMRRATTHAPPGSARGPCVILNRLGVCVCVCVGVCGSSLAHCRHPQTIQPPFTPALSTFRSRNWNRNWNVLSATLSLCNALPLQFVAPHVCVCVCALSSRLIKLPFFFLFLQVS